MIRCETKSMNKLDQHSELIQSDPSSATSSTKHQHYTPEHRNTWFINGLAQINAQCWVMRISVNRCRLLHLHIPLHFCAYKAVYTSCFLMASHTERYGNFDIRWSGCCGQYPSPPICGANRIYQTFPKSPLKPSLELTSRTNAKSWPQSCLSLFSGTSRTGTFA